MGGRDGGELGRGREAGGGVRGGQKEKGSPGVPFSCKTFGEVALFCKTFGNRQFFIVFGEKYGPSVPDVLPQGWAPLADVRKTPVRH